MGKQQLSQADLEKLFKQVGSVWQAFQGMRAEARQILILSDMENVQLNLEDVLQHTEQSTLKILKAATDIGALTEKQGMPNEVNAQVAEKISEIYEACSFQDITGQRIKRILRQINELGSQLQRLSEMSCSFSGPKNGANIAPVQECDKDLMNGPQLSKDASSQSEIDSLLDNA